MPFKHNVKISKPYVKITNNLHMMI